MAIFDISDLRESNALRLPGVTARWLSVDWTALIMARVTSSIVTEPLGV
jgi:hypothetical protein